MADELTLAASLEYSDSQGTDDTLSFSDVKIDVATKQIAHIKKSIGTTEEALNKGGIVTQGFLILKNLDATNFVVVKVASSGVSFAKLFPGEIMLVPLGAAVDTPYIQADTASCQVEYILVAR